jgi:Ni/Co efflux regulator RcnB
MRTSRIIAAVSAGSLFLGSVAAFAQGAERNQELLDQQQRDRHDGHQVAPAPSTHSDQRYDPRYYQRYDSNDQRFYPGDRAGGDWRGRGAGPNHDWYRGSRLPREYNSRNYVVDDWRAHHLSAPPSGYHWVQSGGDYVLAAIATGVIAAILLNQ